MNFYRIWHHRYFTYRRQYPITQLQILLTKFIITSPLCSCGVPLFRPEHRSFCRDQPVRGAAWMPLVFGGGWEAPSENPRQKREAQESGGIRVAFLLDTFLWPCKEKYLAFGGETPIKTTVAIATHKKAMFKPRQKLIVQRRSGCRRCPRFCIFSAIHKSRADCP